MKESFIICSRCGGNACHEVSNDKLTIWSCFGCGFTANSTLTEEKLEEVESVTIARALINADETIVEKLVNLRPKREQLLIKSEIDYNKDLALEEIEKARKIILDKLKGKLTA